MSGDAGNGHPAFTPPAFVRQLAERVDDLTKKYNTLKSLVGANHLATMHEIGDLAEMAKDQGKRIVSIEKMVTAANKLLLQISEKLSDEDD